MHGCSKTTHVTPYLFFNRCKSFTWKLCQPLASLVCFSQSSAIGGSGNIVTGRNPLRHPRGGCVRPVLGSRVGRPSACIVDRLQRPHPPACSAAPIRMRAANHSSEHGRATRCAGCWEMSDVVQNTFLPIEEQTT